MYEREFKEEDATIPKNSCVHCGLGDFLKAESYFELPILSPNLNLAFLQSRSGVLYRMGRKLDYVTLCGITTSEQVFLDFKVVTN